MKIDDKATGMMTASLEKGGTLEANPSEADRGNIALVNKETQYRYIRGNISRVALSQVNQFGKYSLYVDGEFTDNGEPFKGLLSSKYDVRAYRQGVYDQINPKEIEGIEFLGQVYVAQKYLPELGETMCFPVAVEYVEYRGEDRRWNGVGSPFSAFPYKRQEVD